MDLSGSPAIVHVMVPRVAIMDIGPSYGVSPEAEQTMHTSPGLEDIWQLHYAVEANQQNNAPEQFVVTHRRIARAMGLCSPPTPTALFPSPMRATGPPWSAQLDRL